MRMAMGVALGRVLEAAGLGPYSIFLQPIGYEAVRRVFSDAGAAFVLTAEAHTLGFAPIAKRGVVDVRAEEAGAWANL